jgi:putative flippase GtrA
LPDFQAITSRRLCLALRFTGSIARVQSYELRADLAAPRVRGLRALYERFAHIIREAGKFGVVGAVCYVIDLSVFNFAEGQLGWAWFPALVLSTVISATCAFIGNRFWTWRHSSSLALHREYGLFFLFNLVGLAIGSGLLLLSHDALGGIWPVLQTRLADNISGKVIGVGLASLFRFWAYRRYVFRSPEAAS